MARRVGFAPIGASLVMTVSLDRLSKLSFGRAAAARVAAELAAPWLTKPCGGRIAIGDEGAVPVIFRRFAVAQSGAERRQRRPAQRQAVTHLTAQREDLGVDVRRFGTDHRTRAGADRHAADGVAVQIRVAARTADVERARIVGCVGADLPAIAVDTHVFRVANRIGLTTNARTPLAVEKQLVEFLPEQTLAIAHHWLILHGRYICIARNPKCDICPLTWFCKYYERTHTETYLLKAEAAKAKKAKDQKKKKQLSAISKELKKRSVDKDI